MNLERGQNIPESLILMKITQREDCQMNVTKELKGLKRISEFTLGTSLIITPLSIIFSQLTGSATLLVYFIWAAAAIAVKLFALISIRIIIRENQFMFPYGSGKLENFSSFFFGFTIIPLGGYFLVVSFINLFSPLQEITSYIT